MILALGIAAVLASGCVPVEGDRILVSHLAAADALFAPLPGDTTVGFAPAPGAVRTFAAGDLSRLALRFGLSGKPGKGACFERATEPIDGDRLLAVMKSTLANPEARIEIVEYSHYATPRGDIVFPLEGLAAPLSVGPARGIARWRGYVRDREGRKVSIWARVKVIAPVEQVVAAAVLKPGEPVSATQLRLEKHEAFPLQRTWLGSVGEALGRKPRRTIAADTVLEPAMLDELHDVERGAPVEAEVHSGAVVLKIEAVAENSGRRGDTVILKNPTSGKKFTARVAGKNKVVVP